MGSTLLGPESEFSCPTLQGHKAYEPPLAFIQAFKAPCQTEKWPVLLWRHCVVLLHFSLINVWNLFPLRLLDSSQREKWSLKALLEKLSALSIVQRLMSRSLACTGVLLPVGSEPILKVPILVKTNPSTALITNQSFFFSLQFHVWMVDYNCLDITVKKKSVIKILKINHIK